MLHLDHWFGCIRLVSGAGMVIACLGALKYYGTAPGSEIMPTISDTITAPTNIISTGSCEAQDGVNVQTQDGYMHDAQSSDGWIHTLWQRNRCI